MKYIGIILILVGIIIFFFSFFLNFRPADYYKEEDFENSKEILDDDFLTLFNNLKSFIKIIGIIIFLIGWISYFI